MKKSAKFILMLSVFLCCTGFDQISKNVARQYLAGTAGHSFLGSILQFEYIENSGAMLGLGGGLPLSLRIAVLVLLNTLVLFGLLVYLWRTPDIRPLGITGGMLIISGGFNNIFDRLINQGRVVDFMHIGIGWLRTGIFNVADVAIMAGLALLFISLNSGKRQEPACSETET